MKTLLSKCSILFLQEHWLSDGQLPLLRNVNINFIYAGVSGFGNDEILQGRYHHLVAVPFYGVQT